MQGSQLASVDRSECDPNPTNPYLKGALWASQGLKFVLEVTEMAERETGTVKWFDEQRGYGFIARDSGGDVFVHYAAIAEPGFRSLSEGDRVKFAVEQTPKGLAAVNVYRIW